VGLPATPINDDEDEIRVDSGSRGTFSSPSSSVESPRRVLTTSVDVENHAMLGRSMSRGRERHQIEEEEEEEDGNSLKCDAAAILNVRPMEENGGSTDQESDIPMSSPANSSKSRPSTAKTTFDCSTLPSTLESSKTSAEIVDIFNRVPISPTPDGVADIAPLTNGWREGQEVDIELT
jgi:hypothetical protein